MAGGRLPGQPGGAPVPDHAALDALEEIWAWGLAELGLPRREWGGYDAVLVVTQDMTAREVRGCGRG
jgi:hypothetical protein